MSVDAVLIFNKNFLVFWVSVAAGQYKHYTKYDENNKSIFFYLRAQPFLFSFAIRFGKEECSNLIKMSVFNYFGTFWSVCPRFA